MSDSTPTTRSDAPSSQNPSGAPPSTPDSQEPTAAERFLREAPPPEHLHIAGYEILELLGRGGMAVVYKARQVSCDRVVALKLLVSGQLAASEELRRFQREARASARLDHPNIVPIYEVGEHRGHHYFSMKLVEGDRLAEHLPQLTADHSAAARLLATVARAVHYAHQHGILHRDLKPANILLDAQAQPHVADFGLAKWLGDEASLTRSNTILGTPSYMAPEQAFARKDLGVAVDVYALGAILYECLTGRPPFRGETALDTLLDVREKTPQPPRQLNSCVDPGLELLCLKCLDKDPAGRYASAQALAEELDRWLAGEMLRTEWGSRGILSWRRRSAVVSLLFAVLVIVSLSVGIQYLSRPAPSSEDAGPTTPSAEDKRRLRRNLDEAPMDHAPLTREELIKQGNFAAVYDQIRATSPENAEAAKKAIQELLKDWIVYFRKQLGAKRFREAEVSASELLKRERGNVEVLKVRLEVAVQLGQINGEVGGLIRQKQFDGAEKRLDELWPTNDELRAEICRGRQGLTETQRLEQELPEGKIAWELLKEDADNVEARRQLKDLCRNLIRFGKARDTTPGGRKQAVDSCSILVPTLTRPSR
jgi:serine/threonine protein kinase